MKEFAALFLIALFVASCGSKVETSPLAYNDSLVAIQVNIAKKAEELQATFDVYNPQAMDTVFREMRLLVDKSTPKVKTMGDFRGDDAFRKAILNWVELYAGFNGNEFPEIIRLLSKPDSLYSPADEKRVESLIKQIDRKTQEEAAKVKRAQEAFAKANKLSLEEEPPAEASGN